LRTGSALPYILLGVALLVALGFEFVNGFHDTANAVATDLARVPNDQVRNFRNDMYLTSEALRIMQKSGEPQLAATDVAVLKNYKTTSTAPRASFLCG
jgi:hypothetical protein